MIGCHVNLWGSRIGTLTLGVDGKTSLFAYDRDFLTSGIELSPLQMPLADRVYQFPLLPYGSFHGLPGIFADSLPDSYGNKVIDAYCVAHGRNPSSFTPLERLCYVGKHGMGALEYAPTIERTSKNEQPLLIEELTAFASSILKQRTEFSLPKGEHQLDSLFRLSSSAGGARAKALIAWNEQTGEIRSGQVFQGPGFGYYLIKFDAIGGNKDKEAEDPLHYPLIEYVYSRLALAAGIRMSPCRLLKDKGNFHFLTQRFDRDDQGGKIMMASLAGLAHCDFNSPGSYSYEQGALVMDSLGIPAIEKEDYFRRMVFNVVFRNQDDHVKNISFLMNRRGEWHLAPAYDLTFAYNPEGLFTAFHQMQIHGKIDKITREDVLASGKTMGLAKNKIERILSQVLSVVPLWVSEAEKWGISKKWSQEIDSQFIRW